MTTFYTNVKQYGNNILYRGIKNGKRVQAKVPYRPSLFLPTNEESKYKTIYGENLIKKRFDTIKDSRQFVDQYKEVENFKIYGNTKYEYCFISEAHKGDIDWDYSKIRICIFDIEVDSNPDTGGFASPENPFQPITSIALKFVGEDTSYLLGYHDFDAPKNVQYYKCKDEWTLLKTLIQIWSLDHPDCISGWNISGFDIKYLVNRCYKILGEPETKNLSPWKVIKEKKTRKFNPKFNQYEEDVEYSFLGISTLDYLDLFKKYHPEGKSQESYKLDHIAENEIGENKVEYDGSLHRLYTEDKNKFYLYNLQDVHLIEKINDKCRLFELGLTLAYDSKTNPEDIFFQTVMWDVLIYNFLNKRNIQLPQMRQNESQDYAGAYVKSPQTGMHRWVVSLDATSLYPSVIMGKNISPETLVPVEEYSDNMRNVISSGVNVETLLSGSVNLDFLEKDNVTITPNGQFFRTDKKGFLPEMIEKMFADRQMYKKKMLQAQKEYEIVSSEYRKSKSDDLKTKLDELEYDISRFNNLQNSKKLCLNSAYGALGARQFRLFDTRLAEAITLEGQLSNRWVANGINVFFCSLLKVDKDFIIYGDTDSLIISFEDVVNKVCGKDVDPNKIANSLLKMIDHKIQPAVDSLCLQLKEYVNSYKNSLSYKLEKICSTGIFVAKKRYALNVFSNEGVIYSEPKIKVTGMEIVKSSTPAIVRDSLKDCIKIMMNENEESLQNYVFSFKNKFASYDVEEISFPRGVNGLHKYSDSTTLYKKATPIHVRGSILFNKLLDDKKLSSEYEYIKDGDKIKFCYLKTPNSIKENVIAFPEKLPKEFDLSGDIDYNKMYNKVFLEPLKSITEVIGWEMEKRNRLEDFF